MNTFEYIKGKPVLQEETFTFTPDIPVTGSFQFQYGAFTVSGLDAVPGDYPLSMGVAGLRRPHASADGEECSLEMTDSVPFGAEPEVQKRFEFSDGRMAVRTDFILRPSFEMRSITAGGLKVEGLAKLQIAEQVASGALQNGELIDFAALPDGQDRSNRSRFGRDHLQRRAGGKRIFDRIHVKVSYARLLLGGREPR